MAANMWKNSLKIVESDNNKILYGKLLHILQRNGTFFLSKLRITNSCIWITCVTLQGIDYKLPKDDTIVSKHVAVW